jgi:hypothetical protein
VSVLTIALFLHVLSAATWLAAALWTTGDVRRTLALGRPHTDALPQRARPALALDLWAGVATLLTGLAVIGLQGGVPKLGVMVGLAAALVRLAILGLTILPAARTIWRALEMGDLAGAAAPAKRLAMLSGIGHLLWLIALGGMIFG